jgi:hypothetical protein
MTKISLPLTLFCFFSFSVAVNCQSLAIKKGIVVDSLKVRDSLPETFALYLPKDFELKGKWPLVAIFDMKGQGKKELSKFIGIAERYGYVMVASNAIHDSLSLSENMLRTKGMMEHLLNLLPLNKSRIYTAGFENGGRFANLAPIFLKDIQGTLSINAAIANIELLNDKNPFQFIGVSDKTNFNYPILLKDEKILNGLRFPNSIIVSDSSAEDIRNRMSQAFSYFELLAMSRGNSTKDTVLIGELYAEDMERIDALLADNKYLEANRAMAETMNAFRALRSTDDLKERKKEVKRSKNFRAQKREEEAAIFKEALLREDFAYYLEEDVLTYNFNNLGWWNYQKGQLDKYIKGSSIVERQMGHRLNGYVNALIEDNIDLVTNQKVIDEEALVFLYMLKTITAPNNFDYYFKVASIASKNEDYGTALFYLEEAMKNGFKSKEDLYAIPHTALLRITPEFNALVKKYFNDARYKITNE